MTASSSPFAGFHQVDRRFAEPVVHAPADGNVVVVDEVDGDEQAAVGVVLVFGCHGGEARARQVEAHAGREGLKVGQRHPKRS